MDWCRKHMCDLAAVCRNCKQNPMLSTTQSTAFAAAHTLAHHISSLPDAGGICSVDTAIAMACGACKDAMLHDCSGRDDWRQACLLVRQHILREQ